MKLNITGKLCEAKLLIPDLKKIIACNWWEETIKNFSKPRNLSPNFKFFFVLQPLTGKPSKHFIRGGMKIRIKFIFKCRFTLLFWINIIFIGVIGLVVVLLHV